MVRDPQGKPCRGHTEAAGQTAVRASRHRQCATDTLPIPHPQPAGHESSLPAAPLRRGPLETHWLQAPWALTTAALQQEARRLCRLRWPSHEAWSWNPGAAARWGVPRTAGSACRKPQEQARPDAQQDRAAAQGRAGPLGRSGRRHEEPA